MRRTRKLLLWTTILLLICGVWAGLHAASKGFTKSWREKIRQEFADRGMDISIGKLTLDPLNGLVAREVNLYDGSKQPNLLATISQIDLDISLPNLLKGDVTLHGIHVRNADVSIPIDPTRNHSERIHISEFNSRIVLSRDRMEIQEAHGIAFGTTINVAGSFLHKTDGSQFTPIPIKGLSDQTYQNLRNFLSSLASLKFPSGQPAELNIHVSASFDDLEAGQYDAAFRASSMHWNELDAEDVELRLAFTRGLLQLEELRLRDDHGSLRIVADYLPNQRRLSFNLESTTKLADHLRSHLWPDTLPPLTLTEAPTINLGGTLDIPTGNFWSLPHAELTGSLALTHGSFANQLFTSGKCLISVEGGNLYIKNIALLSGDSGITGSILLHRNRQHIQLEGTLPPTPILTTLPLPDELVTWLDLNESANSSFAWNFQSHRSSWQDIWSGEGSFKGENFISHNTPIAKAQTSVRWNNNQIQLLESSLELPANIPHGFDNRPSLDASNLKGMEILLDIASGDVNFTGIHGTAYPNLILNLFAPEFTPPLNNYTFHKAPDLTLNGSFNFRSLSDSTNLEFTFQSDDKVDLLFFNSTLPLENTSASLLFINHSLLIRDLKATLFGGNLDSTISFPDLNDNFQRFTSSSRLTNVSFPDLMTRYGIDAGNTGRLNGTLTLHNLSGIQGDLHGEGEITLADGNLLTLPLFHSLSPLIESTLPNASSKEDIDNAANATFTITKGILTTEDLNAITPMFNLNGSGTFHCLTGKVELATNIDPHGLNNPASEFLSGLFKYHCEGPLHSPRWSAVLAD